MGSTFRWEDLLAEVAKRIPPQQFRAWLEPTRFIQITDAFCTIAAPNQFSRDWINDHYKELFSEALHRLYGLRLELQVDVSSDHSGEKNEFESSALLTIPHSAASSSTPQSVPVKPDATDDLFEHLGSLEPARNHKDKPLELHSPQLSLGEHSSFQDSLTRISVRDMSTRIIKTLGQPLDPKHTFETFVVGASNQFAHAAARAVAEQPATQYNPLFIYSSAGLGKTHLLHAIGNFVLRMNPKAKICYISAEKFLNDVVESIQSGKMAQFRERYRDSYDMLLMDDIQFIANKDRTQEEFFHTFNALHSSRRQIVVTSDKFPKDIPGLEDRIRTRFECGLIADIQPPEIETRIAILKAKAEIDDIFLPNDVALFLASNIKTNVRELEGALIRLGAQASLSGSEISLDLAKQLLKSMITEPNTSITPDAIQEAVARHFSIKVSDLKSKERSRRVAIPRQITMFLIRKYCDKSYPDIGLILGGKDHSTVLYGVRSVAAGIERDAEMRQHVEEIQNTL